ncbi:Cyclin-dependent kinase inhibitor [Cynara cardunculus var. scolymus]|uniref:Cyclin-dependent kinase inhibitor n=1 Tax=Cynara cardunculus var. scolymus TaxID=59895 RepID=A0A103YH88_CYNCS|nr:Cyclin-dependent kinase inhibitor [Cynara cardunculus var. scolymus]
MEFTQVGVRTRARAMPIVGEEAADNLGAVKRRKIGNGKLRSPSSTFVQTNTFVRENYVNSAPEQDLDDSGDSSASLRSSGVPASCCSSTGSTEKLKVSDLEEESHVEIETVARYKLDRSERFSINDYSMCSFIIPSSEFKAKLGELDSTTVKQSSSVMINSRRTVLPAEKMPPAAELEEFFAAAQKDLHKRFRDKYNYDIVNDIPLKGRFEWIQLKPQK